MQVMKLLFSDYKPLLFVIFVVILGTPKLYSTDFNKQISCQASREFVTAISYFRDHKEYSLNDKQILTLAHEISNGCTGASERFIKISSLLVNSHLDSKSAIKTARNFINLSDEETNAFNDIFKKTYLKKYLDLDIRTSVRLSLDLSLSFQEHRQKVVKDFENVAMFCLEDKAFELTGPQCARLAYDVAISGQGFNEEMSAPFKSLFHFITQEGPRRSTAEALKIIRKLISYGPLVFVNYKDAYRFAVSESGLKLDDGQAMKLASMLASRSSQNKKSEMDVLNDKKDQAQQIQDDLDHSSSKK